MTSSLFQARHYNQLADCMASVMLSTKPEHLEVAASILLRVVNNLVMLNSNMQVGRFMNAAGIPSSTSIALTKRSD